MESGPQLLPNGPRVDHDDKQDFRKATGMLAVMGYVLADMPDRLAPPDSQDGRDITQAD